jgi:DNA-binding response OmpR family regulator
MSNEQSSRFIAIVDDDRSVQTALEDLIESEGLSTLCFGSAEQFLDSGAQHKAVCLIADIRMPGMSGLELQTKLKAERCRVPIIFITAHGGAKMRSHPKGLEAGYFVKPTVFVNVKNEMTIAQEEIFGPVLSVIVYDSEDEAIRIANDSKYGLHSAVLRTDIQRARRLASQLQAGRVVINNMTDDPQAPWGGFKYSGVGSEYGKYGIEAFLEPKAILE